MEEIIADLRNLRSITNEDGDELVDHGIIQQLESVLLDYTGKIIRIRITKISPQTLDENG